MIAKKDIPAPESAFYRLKHKKSGRRNSRNEHRTIVETRKGTKTNRADFGKGNAFPRAEMCSPP
ncbi:acetyltransferase [Rhizobium sp. BR 249]|uniref:acetyltransferase n=1 Tax=Rhizobium sp. BR 249 TaxID=3040011 RepID=UPI0039BF632A